MFVQESADLRPLRLKPSGGDAILYGRVTATKGRTVRKLLIAVVAALAGAALAAQSHAAESAAKPTAPPVANIVTCNGVELVSPTIQAVACTTDAVAGANSWEHDYSEVKLQAKPEHDSPPVAAAAGWSSNGPIPVDGNQFCVTLKADPHGGHNGYAVVELALSWDGVQQPTVTFALSHGYLGFCADNIPRSAENFFWEALAVTGASRGDAKVKLQFGGISFAEVP